MSLRLPTEDDDDRIDGQDDTNSDQEERLLNRDKHERANDARPAEENHANVVGERRVDRVDIFAEAR